MIRTLINDSWKFFKTAKTAEEISGKSSEIVNLPHTWNNLDGQDGGGDYYRNACCYQKTLNVNKIDGKDYYLEFRGVNAIATVFVNGNKVVYHEGGFSTFRARITDVINSGDNEIIVIADNSSCDYVYPQMADFTFFGGIYRDVYLLEVDATRFDLDYYGSEGVMITPNASGSVNVKAYVTNPQANTLVKCNVVYNGEVVVSATNNASSVTEFDFNIANPVLWDSIDNPALYVAELSIINNEEVIDERRIRFGFRSFEVNEDGFILNGRSYPLHGVSRHQDRQDMGWAITKKEHAEDMALIKELGANTIRLAHYQHDQYFYDLCDENGMVVWAEIPYISSHLPHGDENAVSQMRELVIQNYNHASIICWGLSNEITMMGESEPIYNLHKRLNDLCHELDKTRYTTMANVTMLDINSNMLNQSDIMSYNHYFGWYVGDVNGNAEWLDDFRKNYPNKPIGLSEYGCEAILKWHNSAPKQGDYSEEYQAYYHESLLKIFADRPYLWSTHVWNMFDFGVDGRNEGGVAGRNNKGLVTYDRKTKKDSYFIYKAYWTKEPFVYLTGRRYYYRAEKVTNVKVYSNCDSVTLFVNGKEQETKQGKYVFNFEVKLNLLGATKIKAVSGNCVDEIEIKRVMKPHSDYILPQEVKKVENWFEKDGVKYEFKYPEDAFSIKDKLGDVMANEEGERFVMSLIDRVIAIMTAGAPEGEKGGMKINKGLIRLVSGMPIERIASMAGDKVTTEMLYEINVELNKIKK